MMPLLWYRTLRMTLPLCCHCKRCALTAEALPNTGNCCSEPAVDLPPRPRHMCLVAMYAADAHRGFAVPTVAVCNLVCHRVEGRRGSSQC